MAAIRTAAKQVTKRAFEGSSPGRHIQLLGLPRTALPNDLRRLCGKSKVENVANAAIDYHRFRPSGEGLLSFTRPEYAAAAYKALNNAVVGGKTVKARTISNVLKPPRARGPQGLLEAGQRGAITGNGPSGGVTGAGRNVVLYGLPGRLPPSTLADNLRDFKLASTEYGREVVVKLEASGKLTYTSRHLVRMASVSEAYRLVRKLHMQSWRPDIHEDKFTVRAFVVW
ncbi:hypothetical protein C8Q79DRAFT_1009253 [Trametes meyenii]|nr:hypothetical protein C8Q79DRAFT_1009253 [Trametes meyenii]